MYAYNYDRETFEYTGKTLAEKNQLASGYLYPAFSVDFPPPEYGEFEKPFFVNAEWVIKPYFKGRKQVELSTKFISNVDYIGEIKDGYQYITDDEALECMQNPFRYDIKDNKLYRLTDKEYNTLIEIMNDNKRIEDIKQELDKLDLKLIRAERDNQEKEIGLTWKQYYLDEIANLRNELQQLQAKTYQ